MAFKKGQTGNKNGRPKGSTTRVRISDYFDDQEKRDFFEDLKVRAKTDTKIALYLAEQMTGKAPQPVTGPDGESLFDPQVKEKSEKVIDEFLKNPGDTQAG